MRIGLIKLVLIMQLCYMIGWKKRPLGISLQSLNIYDMDDFINEKVLEAYEDYVSDFEDRAYENFKDGKCF